MAFTLSIGQTDKARNSTKKPPMSSSFQVLLKDDTSIVKPTWRVHLGQGGAPGSLAELSQMNCCYCAEFNRYYFISNIVSETAVIALVMCEVDVLATYREEIFTTDAFIMYAESKFNSLIPDSRLPMCGASKAITSQVSFGMTDQAGCFVLTAATPNNDGKTGPSASVVMSEGNLMSLANTLYGTDFWEGIKNDFYHPEEAIISCIWTPLVAGNCAEGSYQEIKIGRYSLGGGITAKRTVENILNIHIPFPYAGAEPDVVGHAADYRNLEPYTEYYLHLPGVGLIQLPMHKFFGDGKNSAGNMMLNIRWSASPITGDITYNILRQNNVEGGGISGNPTPLTVKGNFGVKIPVAGKTGNFGSVVQSAMGAISGVAIAAASTNPIVALGAGLGALSSAVSADMGLNQTHTTVSGGLGGWSIRPEYNMAVEVIVVPYEISDEPSNIGKTIGRPLFMKQKIGAMSGLIKCTGAYVKCNATEEEHQMIAQYVNSSTNFIYGGVIIE